MSLTDCGIENPLVRDGKSQNQRLLDALLPSYVSVDERSTADLLIFAREYAKQINYYDPDNELDGNWLDFFDSDISTQIALITAEDTQETRTDWELYYEGHQDDPTRTNLTILFQFVLDMARKMDLWYLRVEDSTAFSEEIEALIKSTMREALYKLVSYDKGATDLVYPVSGEPIGLDYSGFADIWVDQPDPENPIDWNTYVTSIPANSSIYVGDDLTGGEDIDKYLSASEKVQNLYRTFIESQIRIVSESGQYLEETLTDWPLHQPHFALFITFLRLVEFARTHMNGLTQRHLDFYYEKVLKLTPNEPVPDQLHVIFEIAKNVETHKLEEGILMKAGKDELGNDLLYELTNEIVVNKSVVSSLKTIFVDLENNNTVYAATEANSGDGAGGDFDEDSLQNWKPFGSAENQVADDLGFAFASPVLALAEGERTICVDLELNPNTYQTWDEIYPLEDCPGFNSVSDEDETTQFRIFLTTEEGWLEVDQDEINLSETTGGDSMSISFTLGESVLPIIAYNAELHGGTFVTKWPMIRFLVNNQTFTNPYKRLIELELIKAEIEVKVLNLRNLVVQNELTVMDSAKPFQPFGPTPYTGREAGSGPKFYVGSPEVFRKQLLDLSLHVKWGELPPENFGIYYNTPYADAIGGNGLVNSSFELVWTALEDRNWVPLDDTIANNIMFLDDTSVAVPYPPKSARSFVWNDLDNDSLELFSEIDLRLTDFEEWNLNSQRGFLRAELFPLDFLHDEYVNVFAEEVINLANGVTGAEIPNSPYTPIIQEISLDYTARATVDLSPYFKVPSDVDTDPNYQDRRDFEDRVEQFFHIHPFGQRELHPQVDLALVEDETSTYIPFTMMPQYGNEGYLFIGIDKLVSGQSLSLLFQILEASANPDTDNPDSFTWHYLQDNEWRDFKPSEIPANTTDDLTTSGIITFAMPKAVNTDNTILPADLHWIMATVPNNSLSISDLIDVVGQAALAQFQDNDNDPNHLSTPLEAKKVRKLAPKQAAIKGVSQPYSSFGGEIAENGDDFYLRVAERLRHKNRAITIHDYETLVLGEFPSVYKTRCLNHTSRDTQLAPGNVYMIVVSNTINRNAVNPLEPKVDVNTLKKIKEFLFPLMSTFVCLEVRNPTYEQVEVQGTVYIKSGFDQNEYQNQLIEEIKEFLSPWAYQDGQDISFEGKIHRSVILNFIEEREYVDYVVDFLMLHTTASGTTEVEEAIPSTPMVVLVSQTTHTINTEISAVAVQDIDNCDG